MAAGIRGMVLSRRGTGAAFGPGQPSQRPFGACIHQGPNRREKPHERFEQREFNTKNYQLGVQFATRSLHGLKENSKASWAPTALGAVELMVRPSGAG